ncbi:MAG: heavy metal-binding domain-containing protein [Eubacteriaceae bacterium]
MIKKEFITTTGNFEGYQIDKYLGIVNDQIVHFNNYNVLQDKSVYEKSINEMYYNIISNIKDKAENMDANAVVGLKIDIGELKIFGISVFAATASGTAVFISKGSMQVDNENSDIIEARHIRKIILAEEYSQKISNSDIDFNEKIKIIKKLNDEGLTIPLDIIVSFAYNNDFKDDTVIIDLRKKQFDEVLEYLKNYDDYEIACQFNAKLSELKNNNDKKMFYYLYKNIVKVYYEEILPMLDTLNVDILSKTIFPKMLKYKDTYSLKDCEIIDKLTNSMKQFLKLDEKNDINETPWVCPSCGQKNSGKNIWCKACTKGKNGLTEDQEKMIRNIILHLVKINYILKTNSANKQ